jgi:hypothetical protein
MFTEHVGNILHCSEYMYLPFAHVSRETTVSFRRDAADDCSLLVAVSLLDYSGTRCGEEDPAKVCGYVTSEGLGDHNYF